MTGHDRSRAGAERELRRRMLDDAVSHVDDPVTRERLIALRDGKISGREYVAGLTEGSPGRTAVQSFLRDFMALPEDQRAALAAAHERRLDEIVRESAQRPDTTDPETATDILRDAW